MGKTCGMASCFLAVALSCVPTTVRAAERVVLISGAFRRSIPIDEFDTLASTGQAPGFLGDLLRLGRQNPRQLSKLLNEKVRRVEVRRTSVASTVKKYPNHVYICKTTQIVYFT